MGTTPSNTLDLSVSDPSGHEYNVRLESDYFAQGQHRQCYIGTLLNEKAPKHNKKIVLKVFKPEMVTKGADYECVKDLEKSILCHEYCIKFNRAMKEREEECIDSEFNRIPISFPAPLRINIKRAKEALNDSNNQKLIKKVFNSIPIKIKNHKYLTCQLYLKNKTPFKYNKFTSNNGWIDTCSDYQFLSAFSHYSWAASKGKVLINGFQGIQRGHVLFLSDAVIHSDKMGKHGSNDLGLIGISNFFLNHECNEYCKHLPTLNTTSMIEHLGENSMLKVNKSTTYSWELNKTEMEKDEVNLEIVYNQSIENTFNDNPAKKAEKLDDKLQGQAGAVYEQQTVKDNNTDSAPIIQDKMEQIEHVVEAMDAGHGVIEEEEEIDSGDSDDGDIIEEDEVHIINPNINISWFGDDAEQESYHEHKELFDLDANFVDITHDHHDPDDNHQEHAKNNKTMGHEVNEWEFIN